MTPLKSAKIILCLSPYEIFQFAITMISAVSLKPISSVNYTAEMISVVSITPRVSFQQCQ
jgi:hypothetical protein